MSLCVPNVLFFTVFTKMKITYPTQSTRHCCFYFSTKVEFKSTILLYIILLKEKYGGRMGCNNSAVITLVHCLKAESGLSGPLHT